MFEPILIFVYGTLKNGYGNHRLLEDCKFVAKDALRIDGLSGTGFPFASFTDDPEAPLLHGEIYEVDSEEKLRRLDSLEGHPDWYERKKYVTEFLRAEVQAYHYAPTKGILDGRFLKNDGYLWSRDS